MSNIIKQYYIFKFDDKYLKFESLFCKNFVVVSQEDNFSITVSSMVSQYIAVIINKTKSFITETGQKTNFEKSLEKCSTLIAVGVLIFPAVNYEVNKSYTAFV